MNIEFSNKANSLDIQDAITNIYLPYNEADVEYKIIEKLVDGSKVGLLTILTYGSYNWKITAYDSRKLNKLLKSYREKSKQLSFPPPPFAHIFAIKKQDMSDFSFIPSTSVVTIPGANASAAFTSKTSEVFKEEHNIAPIIINDKMKYIPWGGDNQMPYNIIDLIESDETMSTCQMFNAEVCYGS